LRVALYKTVGKLLRCYANTANEMLAAGYTPEQAAEVKQDVIHYEKMRDEVKLASGDYLDMKRFEPAMRHLLDMYIRADSSELLMDFEELGLIELIVEKGEDALDGLPEGIKSNPEAMSEAIENNMRKTIIDENPVNPKYYERMSELLDAIIEERRKQAISYQEYLEKIKDLARKVVKPQGDTKNPYPSSIDTAAKRALFDNLGNDEVLASKIDTAIRYTKRADWVGDRIKEKIVANAIREESAGYDVDVAEVLELAKNQYEYQ
jgi:type I restriction enzyme R subunit